MELSPEESTPKKNSKSDLLKVSHPRHFGGFANVETKGGVAPEHKGQYVGSLSNNTMLQHESGLSSLGTDFGCFANEGNKRGPPRNIKQQLLARFQTTQLHNQSQHALRPDLDSRDYGAHVCHGGRRDIGKDI